jgi:hypothetical protein
MADARTYPDEVAHPSWQVDKNGSAVSVNPAANAPQPANTAGVVVVKNSAGYLWSAVVTTLGTAQLDVYDNASTAAGTKLLSIPASAPVGTIYSFPGGARATNGIVSNGILNCPGVTFHYA